MHEYIENTEKAEKTTVAVRLPKMPVKSHTKIKRFRDDLIRRKGKMVTIEDAYYEFIRTR
jgi:hypothetical protein